MRSPDGVFEGSGGGATDVEPVGVGAGRSIGTVAPAKITDIADTAQLLRYAAKAHVSLIVESRGGPRKQQEVAAAMNIAPAALSGILNGQHGAKPIETILSPLDSAVFAFAPEVGRTTGGLVALAARLAGYSHQNNAVAGIPSSWVAELMQKSFEQPVGSLIQASALLSSLLGAHSEAASDAVCLQHRRDLSKVVEPLLLIGVGPPTPHSIEALIVLGGIARHRIAFEDMKDTLEKTLTGSPLGFRVWRVITSIVQAAKTGELPTKHLSGWVELRLRDSESLRTKSLYPARSLDLELAIAVPAEWVKGTGDWAASVLKDRAKDRKASIRERATAAMGVWERAFNDTDPPTAKRAAKMYLRTLIEDLTKDEKQSRDGLRSFDAIPGGGEWLIASLEHTLSDDKILITNTWQDFNLPFLDAVKTGSDYLATCGEIPGYLLDATQFLFEQSILQNAGVYRRKAIDTLRSTGLAEPIAAAMAKVLDDPRTESWLRCRILFAIGFMQERGDNVEGTLRSAFKYATDELIDGRDGGTLTRDLVSEVHAALFAIGDCFGAFGAEAGATRMRRFLDDAGLWKLVDECATDVLSPIPRAAAYLLTVMTQEDDLKRIEPLKNGHPDLPTRQACEWAAQKRFTEDGKLRPLHRAPLER
jgi:hypothetical protein